MSTNTWAVEVDGVAHQIVLAADPQSGKTVIRVDGRMAARPMAPEESEREFRVGSMTYLLRRSQEGVFDLDIAPPDLTNGAPAQAWSGGAKTLSKRLPQAEEKSGTMATVLKVAGTAVVAVLLYWGWDALMYMRVPWQHWNGPSVRVDFPKEPARHVEHYTVEGQQYEYVAMTADYRKHGYALAWWQLGGVVPDEKVDEVQKVFVDELIKEWRGKVIQRGPARVSSREGIHFVLQVPKSEKYPAGTIRGQLAHYNGRVYVQFAFVPRGAAFSFDVGEFLRSMKFGDRLG
jgi:hypothetical protein